MCVDDLCTAASYDALKVASSLSHCCQGVVGAVPDTEDSSSCVAFSDKALSSRLCFLQQSSIFGVRRGQRRAGWLSRRRRQLCKCGANSSAEACGPLPHRTDTILPAFDRLVGGIVNFSAVKKCSILLRKAGKPSPQSVGLFDQRVCFELAGLDRLFESTPPPPRRIRLSYPFGVIREITVDPAQLSPDGGGHKSRQLIDAHAHITQLLLAVSFNRQERPHLIFSAGLEFAAADF